MQQFDAIVLGAGAAGLMCAGTAAAQGVSLLLLDHAVKAGEKIRISGGGRCNFTNRHLSPANYISRNPHFCKSALARFSNHDFIAMVEAAGIAYHEREHGRLFCNDSAQQIVEMLLAPCRARAVRMQLATSVESVQRQGELFVLRSSRGTFAAPKLVVATGGLSIPKMGATPLGLKIAESFALPIVPVRAGLVPFTFAGSERERLQSLAGISLEVAATCRGQTFREALLFTHRGLSGPAMLQLSSYWLPGDAISIDLLPGVDLAVWVAERRQSGTQAQFGTLLPELLPRRLVQLIADSLPLHLPLPQLSARQIEQAVGQLHAWRLTPSGTEGYRTAEVTLGGVDTALLNSRSMACNTVPGLHFIGEVVDVSGQLGGYNFQWAWSSGHAAGMALAAIP